MVKVVDHELDGLGIFCIHVPVDVVLAILGIASRNIDNASLALLEVALCVVTSTAGKAEELRLSANDGLVDFVDVGTTSDGKIE